MIEKLRTSEVDANKVKLVKLVGNLKEIVIELDKKIKLIEEDNSIYYSYSSINYVDTIKKDIIKIKEFINTCTECMNFLGQVNEKYLEIDNDILNKLDEIGDVK